MNSRATALKKIGFRAFFFEGFLFLESREIEWKKCTAVRMKRTRIYLLNQKIYDVIFELMTDELASMTGLLRGYVQQLDVPEQPALTEELAKICELIYHVNPTTRTKINSHRGRNSLAFWNVSML